MAVFRAPSTSSLGDASALDVRSSTSQLLRRNSSRVNRRPRSGSARPTNADLAASKARRKRIVEKRPAASPAPDAFIYVGNFSKRTNRATLKELFSVCGNVLNIVIRETPISASGEAEMGTSYATILFEGKDAKQRALLMKGVSLDGCQLTVGNSIWDIPIGQRLYNRRREEQEAPRQPLRREPTLQIEDTHGIPRAGVSLARENRRTSLAPKMQAKKKLSTIFERN